jgi:hypothetical protein
MTILLENMICVSHKFGYNPDAIRLLGQYLFDMPTESNNDVSITLEHWGSGIIYKQLRMSKKSTISDIKKILDDYILLKNDHKDDVKLEDFNKDEITFVIGKNIDDFLYLKKLKKLRKKGTFFPIDTMNDCVKNGYLDCLKYLHETGCSCIPTTCFGQLRMVI